MGNRNCDFTIYSGLIYRAKRVLLISKKRLAEEKEFFKIVLEIMELDSRKFECLKTKRNPSNFQIFDSITDSLLVMQENMDIMSMSFSLIEHEIQLMDYVVDSSFKNLIRMFTNSVDRLENPFTELSSRREKCLYILSNLKESILLI